LGPFTRHEDFHLVWQTPNHLIRPALFATRHALGATKAALDAQFHIFHMGMNT
jgi:hypothetical protein